MILSYVVACIAACVWMLYINIVAWRNTPTPLPAISCSPPAQPTPPASSASETDGGRSRNSRGRRAFRDAGGVEIVFGGSGSYCFYQMGVANAIRTHLALSTLDSVPISGMSGGAVAALFTVAYPRRSVSSAQFWDMTRSFSEGAETGGALGLAQGMYTMLRRVLPSLPPEAHARLTEQWGVWVHNMDTGNVCALRGMWCFQELAAAVSASSTVLLYTSGYSHVELRGSRYNDPAIYTWNTLRKGLADTGRHVIYLRMKPPPATADDAGGHPRLDGGLVIHCVDPQRYTFLPSLRMPTMEEKRADFLAGEAWGRSYVVPRLKAQLSAWGY